MKQLGLMLAGLTLFFSTAHAAPVTQIAPGDAQAFHNDIAALFNFDSGTLSGEELDAKLKAIKAFGARLSKDKSRYLPLLRAELARGAYLPVFATQGPTWLIGLSDEPADLQLAADYLARWTIDQVNLEGYVTVLHALAASGADVTAAAMRIADKPDFFTTLRVHVMPIGQLDAMILLLFSMPEERFVGAIADRLQTENNPKIQMTLIQLAYLTATEEGTAALQSFTARKDISDECRKEAQKRISYKGHTHDASVSAADLREKRRAAVRQPVGHDHERGRVFHELSEALIYKVKHQR